MTTNSPTREELLVAAALYAIGERNLLIALDVVTRPEFVAYHDPELLSRARALLGDGWQDIATAPKDRPIDIWIAHSDGGGVRWTDCTHDHICNEWRNHDPGRPIKRVHASAVTHWREPPAPPSEKSDA